MGCEEAEGNDFNTFRDYWHIFFFNPFSNLPFHPAIESQSCDNSDHILYVLFYIHVNCQCLCCIPQLQTVLLLQQMNDTHICICICFLSFQQHWQPRCFFCMSRIKWGSISHKQKRSTSRSGTCIWDRDWDVGDAHVRVWGLSSSRWPLRSDKEP